jgi:lysophospholipase L1-like esterase
MAMRWLVLCGVMLGLSACAATPTARVAPAAEVSASDASATPPPLRSIATATTTSPATSPATRSTQNLFEKEILAFEAADARAGVREGGIVFVGSSSIRGWRTLADDFPDLPVLNRGFGGSRAIDVVRYADRVVLKHRPRVVVFYAGENDLAARDGGTPDDVARRFVTFVDLVHRELPDTRVIFISLKPSPSRASQQERFARANELVRAFVATDPARLSYVDVDGPMRDERGEVRGDLFIADRLHLNAAGYALWRDAVRPALDAAWRDR